MNTSEKSFIYSQLGQLRYETDLHLVPMTIYVGTANPSIARPIDLREKEVNGSAIDLKEN